jgi:hypothetical protein
VRGGVDIIEAALEFMYNGHYDSQARCSDDDLLVFERCLYAFAGFLDMKEPQFRNIVRNKFRV